MGKMNETFQGVSLGPSRRGAFLKFVHMSSSWFKHFRGNTCGNSFSTGMSKHVNCVLLGVSHNHLASVDINKSMWSGHMLFLVITHL